MDCADDTFGELGEPGDVGSAPPTPSPCPPTPSTLPAPSTPAPSGGVDAVEPATKKICMGITGKSAPASPAPPVHFGCVNFVNQHPLKSTHPSISLGLAHD